MKSIKEILEAKGIYQLYVQEGNERQYYGTLIGGKAKKFLELLEQWDKAGGGDGDIVS